MFNWEQEEWHAAICLCFGHLILYAYVTKGKWSVSVRSTMQTLLEKDLFVQHGLASLEEAKLAAEKVALNIPL